ncbi:growth hormone receptor b [Pholidichthys leucotaenia]
MSPSLTMLLFFLHLFTASSLGSASEQGLSQTPPHFTGCVSTDMETFRCRWNVGTFQNLSEPGDLRIFYINRKSPSIFPNNWSECPHYSTEMPHECFFNKNHTSIWTYYSLQLHSRDLAALYDESHFFVQDIVQPDPPYSLNWTLLNVSVTLTHYDIMLSWKPPQSADVESGWMTLEYEVQYRDINSDLWKHEDPVKSTHRSLFGLQTNINFEVRVRCRMLGWEKFGKFSDSVFVHVPTKVSRFPVMALLIFGVLCLVAILMLAIISQQNKLMFILLPPVPGPKIKGIDPELLKKGKLREMASILDGCPNLRPELYNSDPWVEFIELDIEEQTDRLTDLDTDCLVDHSPSSNCSPLLFGFRDDDSGRASCCEPDLPSDPEASAFHPFLPNQTLDKESPSGSSSPVQSSSIGEPPMGEQSRDPLYTQVSEMRSSGKVLLSPEEQTEVEKGARKEATQEKEKNLELIVVNGDQQDYTSELLVGEMSSSLSRMGSTEPTQTSPDIVTVPTLSPPPAYTVLEGVDRQNSLLLTPNLTPAPQLIIPKPMPTPDGYLTPDLLGSVTP